MLNILNMVYTLNFFSSKCSLFHDSNEFGSCIIHILYTGCAKTKKFLRQKVKWVNVGENSSEFVVEKTQRLIIDKAVKNLVGIIQGNSLFGVECRYRAAGLVVLLSGSKSLLF